jgi:hypothetical protein
MAEARCASLQETGKIEPCLRNLELIGDGFGITVDVLLKGVARN